MCAEPNHYQILGVTSTASADEIKKAYRQLAMKYHPDRLQNLSVSARETAEKKFIEATDSYDILNDVEKRTAYDRFGTDSSAGSTTSKTSGPKNEGRTYEDFWTDQWVEVFGPFRSMAGPGDLPTDIPEAKTFETTDQVVEFLNAPIESFIHSDRAVDYMKAYLGNLKRAIVFTLRRDKQIEGKTDQGSLASTSLIKRPGAERLAFALAMYYAQYGRAETMHKTEKGYGLVEKINKTWHRGSMGGDGEWYLADQRRSGDRARRLLGNDLTDTVELLEDAVATVAPFHEETWQIIFPGRMTMQRLERLRSEKSPLVELAIAIREKNPHNEHLWSRHRILIGIREPWKQTTTENRPLDVYHYEDFPFNSNTATVERLLEASQVGVSKFGEDIEIQTAILDTFYHGIGELMSGNTHGLFWERKDSDLTLNVPGYEERMRRMPEHRRILRYYDQLEAELREKMGEIILKISPGIRASYETQRCLTTIKRLGQTTSKEPAQ
ncbi:MAG: J domain-containing protein [Deltaproteobacteria bacterium]|nr:J domain-containing protein [Deltaproteobacteria bacterium]